MNYILQSFVIGVGVASDAFAVATADGMCYKKLKMSKVILIALFFGVFQGIMPLIGYFVGQKLFANIQAFVPYISLVILSLMGLKMIFEGIDKRKNSSNKISSKKLSLGTIFLQSIATSIDALSVGFAITNFNIYMALIFTFIVSIVTFLLSFFGVFIGKKFGNRFESIAEIFGGIILIFIGIVIFLG